MLQRRKWLLLLLVWCAPLAACGSDDREEPQPAQQPDASAEAGLPAIDDSGPSSELDRSEEGGWPDRSGEGEWRVDLINYFELNFLTGSEGFAECFIDALASETQTNYSDLVVVVDFVANNGASEEMLGVRYFVPSKPLWAAALELISEEDAQRVEEIVEQPGPEGRLACRDLYS